MGIWSQIVESVVCSKKSLSFIQGIEGVNKIKDGYNPATWMLEVTTQAQESALGVDFAELYKNSELYRLVLLRNT